MSEPYNSYSRHYDKFWRNEIRFDPRRRRRPVGIVRLYCSSCQAISTFDIYENDPEFFPEPEARGYCDQYHELTPLRATVARIRIRHNLKA